MARRVDLQCNDLLMRISLYCKLYVFADQHGVQSVSFPADRGDLLPVLTDGSTVQDGGWDATFYQVTQRFVFELMHQPISLDAWGQMFPWHLFSSTSQLTLLNSRSCSTYVNDAWENDLFSVSGVSDRTLRTVRVCSTGRRFRYSCATLACWRQPRSVDRASLTGFPSVNSSRGKVCVCVYVWVYLLLAAFCGYIQLDFYRPQQ